MAQPSPKRQKLDDDAPPPLLPSRSIASLVSPKKGIAAAQDGRSSALSAAHSPAAAHREIIQLDLDQFYVAASRIRDPSLVGLPIGIKQKGILATASYEARALGVQKLASVREAVKRCPELILVNGEDLSFFRKLSQRVWRLVRGIVWQGRVEKLGLDELFCDVTEMVSFNLIHQSAECSGTGSSFFRLDKDDATLGFAYDPTHTPGHVLPKLPSSEVSEEVLVAHRRLTLASHLAAHLRRCVLHEVGLTASAGIASNKLLAKLMCAKHKPAEQTVFLPENHTEVLQYLDTYEVRSLNGFGGAIVNKLRACLGGEQLGHSGTEWINGGLGLDPQTALVEARDRDPPVPLTVSLCRKAFTAQSLVDLFGQRLGPRLWGLLHGIDHDEVIPAPLYPHQISIEDTFRGLRGQAQHEQLHILSMSLLRRLEVELVEDEGDLSQPLTLKNEPVTLPSEEGREHPLDLKGMSVRTYVEQDSLSQEMACRRAWRRYPLSVRLSIRQGWENRTSKQTRMPVEVFDLSLSRSQRATALAATLEGLRRSMIATHGDRGEGINLINIAALDLVKQKPAASIGALFANGNANGKGKGKEVVIDEDFLNSLPPDIRKEVMAQYGYVSTHGTTASTDGATSEVDNDVEPNDIDGLAGGEDDEDELICDKCGSVQEAWLQHDHLIWPVFGLPPCFAQLMDKNIWSGSTRVDDRQETQRERQGVMPPSQERH